MKNFIRTILFFSLLGGAIYSVNYFTVGEPLVKVLVSDSKNIGITIDAHYKNYTQASTLVLDVKTVSSTKSAADVFRVLLQYAAQLKQKNFEYILLQSKGNTRFMLKGDYFQKLGSEYEKQNPLYTMRTFTEHVYTPNGDNAFGKWTGGLIGSMTEQMKDFKEFHVQWYINDM